MKFRNDEQRKAVFANMKKEQSKNSSVSPFGSTENMSLNSKNLDMLRDGKVKLNESVSFQSPSQLRKEFTDHVQEAAKSNGPVTEYGITYKRKNGKIRKINATKGKARTATEPASIEMDVKKGENVMIHSHPPKKDEGGIYNKWNRPSGEDITKMIILKEKFDYKYFYIVQADGRFVQYDIENKRKLKSYINKTSNDLSVLAREIESTFDAIKMNLEKNTPKNIPIQKRRESIFRRSFNSWAKHLKNEMGISIDRKPMGFSN